MKLSELPENAVIHCATLEEAKRITKLLHEDTSGRFARRWSSGRDWRNIEVCLVMHESYGEGLCVNPYSACYGSRKYYDKTPGFIVTPSTDIEP